jgi:ectoine hydroxylase-related dioxygenase (phytanoyl-CoA dioxygenase family)
VADAEQANGSRARVIDQTEWHTDGLRQGRTHGFSLLVGVVLSDCDEDFCGNLLIWPGSHEPVHACAVGTHGALDLGRLRRMYGHDSLPLSSTSSSQGTVPGQEDTIHDNEPSDLPPLGEPLQLRAKAGDVVILHPDTAHSGGPNLSHTIRSMVYFRLRAKTNGAGRRSWAEVEKLHRHNMWVDLSGVDSAASHRWK